MSTSEPPSKYAAGSEHVSAPLPSPDTLDQELHHPKGWLNLRLFFSLLIVGCSMCLFGYDNSFASPLMQLPLFIEKYQGPGLTFTAKNLDLLVPVPLVGAAMGTFAASFAMKKFGRKRTLIASYVFLCIPGSFLQLFAPDMAAMVVGRFWNYIGISIMTTVAPLYLTELVPAHVRGRAVGFCVAAIAAVGIIATTIVWATEKINDHRQYQIPLAIQAAFPCGLAVASLFLPESPVWYMIHHRPDDAHRVLSSVRGDNLDLVNAELRILQRALEEDAARSEQVHFWSILDQQNLKRTVTAGALLSSGQVGGQILVGTYATVMLVQSGVGNPFQITIIISCTNFLGTLIGPYLVDKVGRRPVALVGFAILLILNLAAGSLAAAGLTTESRQLGLASVMIIFAFFNSASFQSLSFVLPTEVARPALREPTMAWAAFWSYTTAVITTFAVPQIMSPDAANLGAKTAYIFAGCLVVTIIWTYFFIPETANRTLAEIEEMYSIGLPMSKWRGYKCSVVADVSAQYGENKTV